MVFAFLFTTSRNAQRLPVSLCVSPMIYVSPYGSSAFFCNPLISKEIKSCLSDQEEP